MRITFASAMLCAGLKTVAAAGRRAESAGLKNMRRNKTTKLPRMMSTTHASAMLCAGVRTAAAAGRRAEGARPEEREERVDEVAAHDELSPCERDALRGREDGGGRWRRAESARPQEHEGGEAVDRAQLRGDVAHGGRHADAAVLQLCLAAAREVFRCEASKVPEANRRLLAALVLEGAERRGRGQSLALG